MSVNFETGLARMALLKKDSSGGDLDMIYDNIPVYRWHAVAAQLRYFDREFINTGYKSRPPAERRKLEEFHDNYERLTNWGYDLQERAIASMLNSRRSLPVSVSPAVTQDALIETIRQVIAPRLHDHDGKIKQHDEMLEKIKESVPALRDENEFISVKQAIMEHGLDPSVMPLHPRSRENFSGLAGQMLKSKGAETGEKIMSRLDGGAVGTQMNTYKRRDIYDVLKEIMSHKQEGFDF